MKATYNKAQLKKALTELTKYAAKEGPLSHVFNATVVDDFKNAPDTWVYAAPKAVSIRKRTDKDKIIRDLRRQLEEKDKIIKSLQKQLSKKEIFDKIFDKVA